MHNYDKYLKLPKTINRFPTAHVASIAAKYFSLYCSRTLPDLKLKQQNFPE